MNYSSVTSRQNVNKWLKLHTTQAQTVDNAYTYVDDQNITWIENYAVKIGFHTLVILKSTVNDEYSCHIVEHEFIVPNQPFPNVGKFASYDIMLTSLTDMYTKLWSLDN